MENNLTLEAKEAIRGYLLKLFAIPSIIVTILAFAAGFIINDVARKDAYSKAYDQAQSQITSLAIKASDAVSEANHSQKDVESIKSKVEQILSEANKLKGELDTLAALQKSKNITQDVADSLNGRPDFISTVTGDLGTKVDNLNDKVSKLSSAISPGLRRKKCEFMDSAENGGQLICKSGWYVAGARNHPNRNDTLDNIYCCQL